MFLAELLYCCFQQPKLIYSKCLYSHSLSLSLCTSHLFSLSYTHFYMHGMVNKSRMLHILCCNHMRWKDFPKLTASPGERFNSRPTITSMRTLASLVYSKSDVAGLLYRLWNSFRTEFCGCGMYSNILTGSPATKISRVPLLSLG